MRLYLLFVFSFSLFLINSPSFALSTTTSISPMILPTFIDVGISEEFILHQQNTALIKINYNDKGCPDCRDSGNSFGTGVGAFYRHYLTSAAETSWLAEMGLSYFKGKAKESSTGESSEKGLWEASLTGGRRRVFNDLFFYDLLAGAIFRTNEIKAGKYTGYTRATPAISFSIGVYF